MAPLAPKRLILSRRGSRPFYHEIADANADDESNENNVWRDSKPIATLFLTQQSRMLTFADSLLGVLPESRHKCLFTLLESVFRAFDHIARHHGVFKVETVGAVAGLPEPQPDHALIMERFATECRLNMNDVTRKL